MPPSDSITFTGAIKGLALDRKTADLIVSITIDPDSGTTHYDMRSWEHQLLDVELRPARTIPIIPGVTSPIKDPVRTQIQNKRAERMLNNFLTDEDDYDDN